MEYRVEELATAAGMGVDTVRFYQAQRLIPAPSRQGRVAIYGDRHLDTLNRIRDLKADGFTLAQIRRVLEASQSRSKIPAPDEGSAEPLLQALMREKVGGRTLSRDELARETGIPPSLVRAAEAAGLIAALQVDDEERFAESDVELARSALAMLEAGIPLQPLLATARQHVTQTEAICERAIDLFDDHVRKQGPSSGDDEAISAVFRDLLPQVTRVVALHFQRTLVNQALQRLEGRQELSALRAAIAATDEARLEVEWR